jgi:hypothetical protein
MSYGRRKEGSNSMKDKERGKRVRKCGEEGGKAMARGRDTDQEQQGSVEGRKE